MERSPRRADETLRPVPPVQNDLVARASIRDLAEADRRLYRELVESFVERLDAGELR